MPGNVTLPLSVRHRPLHYHCLASELSPCSSRRRKSFLKKLVLLSQLIHCYRQHREVRASKWTKDTPALNKKISYVCAKWYQQTASEGNLPWLLQLLLMFQAWAYLPLRMVNMSINIYLPCIRNKMFNPRVRIGSHFPLQQMPHVFKLESGACGVNKKPFSLGSKYISDL